LPVHLAGNAVDLPALRRLADPAPIVEDACHALGTTMTFGNIVERVGDGRHGAMACFSFHPVKTITTGEGGMVTTNDGELARVARRLRDHAFSADRHFWHRNLGFNYRMTNLQAAVGLAQTERLGELVEARRTNARLYHERLAGVGGLTLPIEQPGVTNVFWMYALRVEDDFGCSRDELRRRLARQGIETRTFFIPIHLQPIYYRRFLGQRFAVAEELCRTGLYLPSGPSLAPADIAWVTEQLQAAARAPAAATTHRSVAAHPQVAT
jgi:perosamine synthetase